MIEKIIGLDKQVFVFLNGLGSEQYDSFWKIITSQINWIPLFVFLFYLVFKKLGWRHSVLVLIFIAVLIALTDQTTNLFKYSFQRLRPCNDPEINSYIRIILSRKSFSFISGHASNSFASALSLYLILKPYFKYIGLIFLWPLLFAYSRIYLGLHFPLDILCGFAWGALTSLFVFQIYKIARKRFFPQSEAY